MISIIWWSLFRRLYGCGDFKKIISRTAQTIIAILVLGYQLCAGWTWQEIGIALGVSIWVVIQYFSRAVGEIIDAGLNPCQSHKSYDRWFTGLVNFIVRCLNWIFDKLHTGWHIHKYYGVYDWIYSAFRNFWGVLPAIFLYPSCWWLVIFSFYPVYRFWYWVFDKRPKMYENKVLKKLDLNQPKNWSELCVGAIFSIPLLYI